LIYLLTAIGLTPSTVHIYTQTIHRTTQLANLVGRLSGIRTQSGQTKICNELTACKLSPNWEECGLYPVSANYTLAFVLQLRKKHGKTSVRVVFLIKLPLMHLFIKLVYKIHHVLQNVTYHYLHSNM